MQFVLLQPGNRVRLTEKFVENHGAPWSTGVVIGYGNWNGKTGLVRVKTDANGNIEFCAPWILEREEDGLIGSAPTSEELARIEGGEPSTNILFGD